MTADALKVVQKEHQLALKEQAESFALQMKEFEATIKAQLQQLQDQATQHPPANQLTPDCAIHGHHDDVPEPNFIDAAYDGELEDHDNSKTPSWGHSVEDDDD